MNKFWRNVRGVRSEMAGLRPRLSRVAPTYYSEAFLARSLHRVIAQNVAGLENVVIGCGSSDAIRAIPELARGQLGYFVAGCDQDQYEQRQMSAIESLDSRRA